MSTRRQRRVMKRRPRRPNAPETVNVGQVIVMAAISFAFVLAFTFALSRTPAFHQRVQSSSPASLQASDATSEPESTAPQSTSTFTCSSVHVTDGDSLRCDGRRIRLASIDAPEMPGHCRRGRTCTPGDPHASKTNLEQLTRRTNVQCRQTDVDHYQRIIAFCEADGVDLSCAQVGGGFAVVRYGELSCPRP